MGRPFLNIAFDFVDRRDLLVQVDQAVAGGADLVEVGTPLLKRYGYGVLSEVSKILPPTVGLYADLKLLDFPAAEVPPALEAGATVVSALVYATDETLLEASEIVRGHGAHLWVSTMGWEGESLRSRVAHLNGLGVSTFIAHGAGKDPCDAFDQMLARARFLADVDDIVIVLGGGITLANLRDAVALSPAGIIVGRGAMAGADVGTSVRAFRRRLSQAE